VHHCGTIKSALILLMHGTNMKIKVFLLYATKVRGSAIGLKHYAATQKVAGSVPDGVTGNFH
jgi:hypothetical protein